MIAEDLILERLQTGEEVALIGKSKTMKEIRLLLHFCGILQTCLANMPYEHILQQAFHDKNETYVLIHKEIIIGGLIFQVQNHPKIDKRYCRLSLMAIMQEYQQRGYGTVLVNYLKKKLQERSIKHLVTHADNNALIFYEKLGFMKPENLSPNILEKEKAADYTNSTLMSTIIDSDANYFILKKKLQLQASFFNEFLKSRLNLKQQTVDLSKLKTPYRLEDKKDCKVFQINPFELDGISERGWNTKEMGQIENKLLTSKSALYWKQNNLLKQLMSEAHQNLIKLPDMLQYSPLFFHPMDLQSILNLQEQQKYASDLEFYEDIEKLFSNWMNFYAQTPFMLDYVQKMAKMFEMMTSRCKLKIVR